MKKKIATLTGLAALGVSLLTSSPTLADSPTYVSFGPTPNNTNSTLLIPGVWNLQSRIVWLQGSSDKATSKFSLQTGNGAYVIVSNNAAGQLITVNQTNGLAANDPLMIQSADGRFITNCTISSFPQSTNIIISLNPGWGTTNGDSVFKMSATNTIIIGAVSNKVYTGEAIYVGGRGRPLLISVDGTAYGTVDLVTMRQE